MTILKNFFINPLMFFSRTVSSTILFPVIGILLIFRHVEVESHRNINKKYYTYFPMIYIGNS